MFRPGLVLQSASPLNSISHSTVAELNVSSWLGVAEMTGWVELDRAPFTNSKPLS